MAKALRKQQARLQRRSIAHNTAPYRDEGPSKRKSSGGYPMPGSMNRHKSYPKGRR